MSCGQHRGADATLPDRIRIAREDNRMSDGDTSPRDDGGDEFAPQWRVLTTRWRRGRHVGLAHLLLTPLLVWALSYPVTW